MKLSSWIVVVGALTLSGCGGGDSKENGNGGSGGASGGSGGTSSGGTSAGGMDTGGTSSGGTSSGGDTSMGGGAGEGGAANDSCPTSPPSQDEDCEGAEGELCSFEDATCWCPGAGPNHGTWQCVELPQVDECTDDEPESGPCTEGSLCSYSGGACVCLPQANVWFCSSR